MKDPDTGLSIAPIQHLSLPLQAALRRGLADGQEPLIFFAELVKKLSQNGKGRLSKERLLVVTPELVCVFAPDGIVKRKIRIVDVVALYVSAPHDQTEFYLPALEEQPHRQVCLCVPTHFDAAFELNRHADDVIGMLERVLGVLRRHHMRERAEVTELVVRSVPRMATKPFHSHFHLKKPTNVAREPIIPPSLPAVPEETVKKQQFDHQLQLEEVLSNLLLELHRYQSECWTARNLVYDQVCTARLHQLSEEETLRRYVLATKGRVKELKSTNIERELIIRGALDKAQQAHGDQLEALIQLRKNHTVSLDEVRRRIGESEERAAAIKGKATAQHHEVLGEQRQLEEVVEGLTDELEALLSELETCTLLPTREDLMAEKVELEKACASVEASLAALRERLDDEQRLVVLEKDLRVENSEVEGLVLNAKSELREVSDATRRLLVELSAIEAAKGRLERTLHHHQRERKAIEQSETALIDGADELLAEKERLEKRRKLLELERVVVEDLERETIIHDSITHSLQQVMQHEEEDAMAVQGQLAADRETLFIQERSRSRRAPSNAPSLSGGKD
jgi:hypothetical protein